ARSENPGAHTDGGGAPQGNFRRRRSHHAQIHRQRFVSTLAILGASGHGMVVADAALLAGWDDVVFFDDAARDIRQTDQWKILGDGAAMLARRTDYDAAIVAIGDNAVR